MTILVVGATAHFGRQTVETLAAQGHHVRALTRNPDKAALPAGVELVRADLTEPETLAPAVEGLEAMFVVLPYKMNPSALLGAARKAGVPRVVFLSSGATSGVIADYHHDVERQIAQTAAESTFLRILFPAINSLPFARQLSGGDIVRAPYGDAATAPIHESDVADVAVRVLTEDGHAGKVYDLTGPQSLTQRDQIHVLAETLKRPLAFEELDPAPVRARMARFMDAEFVNNLFDLMAQTVGAEAAVNSIVERITGNPARTYEQWTIDHLNDFC